MDKDLKGKKMSVVGSTTQEPSFMRERQKSIRLLQLRRESGIQSSFEVLKDDEKDNITGFTGREKKMVWESWKKMSYSADLVLWLLDNVPGMKERFNTFDANKPRDELVGDEMFLQHAKTLTGEMHRIITLLPSPEAMLERVTLVAHSHVHKAPSVGVEYFEAIHRNIAGFVSARAKQPEDSELCQVWTKLVGIMCDMVRREEKKKQKKKRRCCVIL